MKGKNITEASAQSSQVFQTFTSVGINVKDLLDLVKEAYSDIFPKYVTKVLCVGRNKTKLGKSMKYSIKTNDFEELQRKHENTLRENDK